MMMKQTMIALAMLSVAPVALAQSATPPAIPPEVEQAMVQSSPGVIAAPAEPDAIPLYGDRTPGSAKTENWSRLGSNVVVRNVTRPTITPVLPDPANATGAAVVIAPGGGFTALSMDTEGFEVARYLASHGIAAFVLKYRLLKTPVDEKEAQRFSVQRIISALADSKLGGEMLRSPESTEDGLAALALVRAGADKWGIDPARVGMMGFSAGAMTSLKAALAPATSARPSFVGFVYGPQIAVPVPDDAPPLFDAIAVNDPIFPTMGFPIAEAWLKARRPVEIHAYGRGGHGFGMGQKGTTTTLLMDEFVAWLAMQGFLKRPAVR